MSTTSYTNDNNTPHQTQKNSEERFPHHNSHTVFLFIAVVGNAVIARRENTKHTKKHIMIALDRIALIESQNSSTIIYTQK